MQSQESSQVGISDEGSIRATQKDYLCVWLVSHMRTFAGEGADCFLSDGGIFSVRACED